MSDTDSIIKTMEMLIVSIKRDLFFSLNKMRHRMERHMFFLGFLESRSYIRPFRTAVMITVQTPKNCLYKITGCVTVFVVTLH